VGFKNKSYIESEGDTMDCEGMQTKIGLLYKQKKYKEVEDKINELIDYVKKKDNVSGLEKHYLCYCYIKLANCERRKDKYKLAIEMAKKALTYCTIKSEKYECYWILGICYKYLNNTNKALYYYDKCIDFYSRIEDIEFLVKVLKCKALMLYDEQLLQDAIDILKKSDDIDLVLYEDLNKTLNEMKIYNKCDNERSDVSNIISINTYKALHNKQ
jgi:tetratricopeptide (TPR) repeat protein